MIFQVRHINGYKLAEYDLAEQVRYFLKDRHPQHYEVWVLESEPPSDLKGIYSASEFIPQLQREATG